jgi:pre-mRNA cleavage complex 2 protein Pcf11
MDAKQVGERIYHATCYEEAYGGKAQARMKRDTPEPSILGKRKAEVSRLYEHVLILKLIWIQDEHVALRTKIKTEIV